jgi:AraC-like DNA-binding protein
MKLTIKPVINQQLTESIQYYIFCTSEQRETNSYQTFPNTNLCLSIYKSNKITYDQDINFCEIRDSSSYFTSKLWGFHEKIFNVSIDIAIDQVCILFHPGGIRNFTTIPYEILLQSDDAFGMIFGKEGTYFLENLFETSDTRKRVSLIEIFLLKKHNEIAKKHAVHRAVQRILKTGGNVKIETLAKDLGINNSTLYNNFISFIGQSPKDFIKTVRFRAALSSLKQQKAVSLTSISYSANYYDQSHFIKELHQLTSYTPKEVRNRAVVEQENLIWINNS